MFARGHSFSSETDNSSNTGLGKPLGSYPNIQHEMLSRNEAQQRPGHWPSAPQAFHQLQRAQTFANEKRTPQPKQNQPGAPMAAEGSAGISSTTCTRLIPGGPPSPSPLGSTTHHAVPLPLQAAPTTIGEARQDRRAHPAPHYSSKKGTEHAGSSSLQLGGRSMPAAATPAAVRGTLQPTSAISLDKLENPHMHRPTRGPPFGAGHEHAKHAMDPKPINIKQIISEDREKLQARTQSPEARQLLKLGTQHMLMPARDLPFGAGYEQAKPAMNPLPANNKGGGSTPAAATPAAARRFLQPKIAKCQAMLQTPHMHWSARVFPFGAGYEQAKPAMDPQHATTKQLISDDYEKLRHAHKHLRLGSCSSSVSYTCTGLHKTFHLGRTTSTPS